MRFIGNVEKDAQVRAIASGALPSGDAVIVNSDGTVSVVGPVAVSQEVGSPTIFEAGIAEDISAAYDAGSQKVVVVYTDGGNAGRGTAVVGTISGTTISFGTPVVFTSSTLFATGTVYDTSAQKVVIAYTDDGNSFYGTAIVGTVSGTSISFGSPAVFESAWSNQFGLAYDANSQKSVICYRDNGDAEKGTAVVATVSGTSISFGSPAVFEGSTTGEISAAYDANAQKVVVAYSHQFNSGDGTAVVGTVSGTSISFGTPVVFDESTTRYPKAVYDASTQKVVIGYIDGGNSDYGTAIVGTVSGTSISFGLPVVFNSATTSSTLGGAYNEAEGKVIFSYRDGGNLFYGTLIVGTVSGTSISFGSPAVFEPADTREPYSVYDSSNNRVVIAYRDNGNSNYGTAVVVRNAGTESNLTAENFVGFAAHTYADTQSAVVNSTCTVDRNQTGLTAGQTYYVQTDGTLGTTAGDPSVVAGTAISSTSIIVKG